ncbi:MAG: helix-turn-helix transcriptional regulator [Acidobacteriota bacterium]|nr:MAG: helix-turn-helix transcriptional regulator [Acidobacteriota bacterium]
MATEVRMSVPHFQRLFKQSIGTSPAAYLNELRLKRARVLLSEPECFLHIKEVAFQIGFRSTSHFTTEFKNKFGSTPTEFRNQQSEIHQSLSPIRSK